MLRPRHSPMHHENQGIYWGADGLQYHVRQISRDGPYTSQPTMQPRGPASQVAQPMRPMTVDVVDQAIAMRLHHDVNRAHLLARSSVIMIKGVGAMASMMMHALTQHQVELLNTRESLCAMDAHSVAPLRAMPSEARRLRIGLIAGLNAQWEHIQSIREEIAFLERLGNHPDDAAVLGPWRDANVARADESSDDESPEPAAAPADS